MTDPTSRSLVVAGRIRMRPAPLAARDDFPVRPGQNCTHRDDTRDTLSA